MAGIKTITAYRRNFRINLPEDFDRILAVYKNGWQYIEPFTEYKMRRVGCNPDLEFDMIDEVFYIHTYPILSIKFSGRYSRWWVIRKFQQLADIYLPVKYKITYYTNGN